MLRGVVKGFFALAAAVLVLLPASAYAQEGQIAGVVRDTSDALMPGVTVEVSSPALIEKTRTAVTDSSGQYRITNLPVGSSYTLSPTYAGFAFNPLSQSVNNMSADTTANFIVTPSAPAPLLISEFRLRGYAGAQDEFVFVVGCQN